MAADNAQGAPRVLGLAAGLAVVLAMLGPAAAFAETFTVTTTIDKLDGACTPSLCSFRDALRAGEAAP